MPSSRTLEAGKAVIKLSLQDTVSQGLTKVGKKMQVIGGIAAAAGGTIVTAFAAATKSFIDVGDQLTDMSARTGFAVESLSKLSYAAKQSGTSIESVEKAARGMAKLLTSAALGAASSAQTLETLGVSLAEIKGLSPDQQFQTLAAAVANVKDPTTRAALAMKVFGKSGADLLPMLAGGADGMREMFDEAEKLGLVLSEEDAKAAAELDDALNKLSSQVAGINTQIGKAVAGPLADFGDNLSEALTLVLQFARANPGLVKTVAALGAAAAVAGTAAVGIGAAIAAITAAPVIASVAALTAGVAALGLAFLDVEKSVDAAVKAMLRWNGMTPGGIAALEKIQKHFKRWTPPGSGNGEAAGAAPGSNVTSGKDLISLGPLSSGAAPGGGGASNLLLGPMMEKAGLPNNGEKKFNRRIKGWLSKAADAAAALNPIPDIDLDDIKNVGGKIKDGIAGVAEDFGASGDEGSSAAIATLDARNAAQQFGPLALGSKETKEQSLLAEILEELRKGNRGRGGIPIV